MQQNELQHYGVKGMRWGIRRATKKLSRAATAEDRDKAIAKLTKHRGKAIKKVAKLESKRPKLEKAYDRAVTKTDVKAVKLEQKRAKYVKKSTKTFSTDKRRMKNFTKAQMLDMKVKDLQAHSNRAKTMMAKNDRMTELFNRGISDIDSALIDAGRKRIKA